MTDVQKPWLEHYPEGVPPIISKSSIRNIGSLLAARGGSYRDRPAFHCMGKSLTYAELAQHSAAFETWLGSRNINHGDRVAVMLPNCLQYPIALFGILRRGAVVVNINPLGKAAEIQQQLQHSGAVALVTIENFAATAEQAIKDTAVQNVIVATLGDLLGFVQGTIVNFVVRHVKKMVPEYGIPHAVDFTSVLATAPKTHHVGETGPNRMDIAFLQYTSGTSGGKPKAAVLTHGNILDNLAQARAWLDPVFGVRTPCALAALPLWHVFALLVNCFLIMDTGGSSVLIVDPRNISDVVDQYRRHSVNIITGLNRLFRALLDHKADIGWFAYLQGQRDFQTAGFSGLRITLGGGEAIDARVAHAWQRATGCVVTQGYGQTEATAALTVCRLMGSHFVDNVGFPLPSTTIAIQDKDGNPVPQGQEGEVCAQGPQIMQGYWHDQEATAEAIDLDGWLHTGDLGVMNPDGSIKITGRVKDLIIVSGQNVGPGEVERVASEVPGVAECVAIGMPDPDSGERVVLFVVNNTLNIRGETIIDHCRRKLSAYKVPVKVIFVPELPKSAVGKILRFQLREQLASA